MAWRRPRVGERIVHEGVTTMTSYDATGKPTVTKEAWSDQGVILDIHRCDDRCTVQYDDGPIIDNIYIRDLRLCP